jgi:peptidoglycan/xylan/chitin deacetylase (PgdA/CDA1 family)
MTTYEAVSSRSRTRGSFGRYAGYFFAAVVLALAALLLLPSDQGSRLSLALVNGRVVAALPSSTIGEVASGPLALAKPGSTLDITGDVVSLGTGGPVETEVDGMAGSADDHLVDGAVVLVRRGNYELESLVRKTAEIPFKTETRGSGAVVSLAQAGVVGKKVIWQGASSRKQAAVIPLVAPQNAIIKRTAAPKTGQKMAALTFDDGPSKWTQAVLDALAAKHVPATFFVLGVNAANYKSTIQKIRAAGNEVESHSWNHPDLTTLTPEQVKSQLSRTAAIIGQTDFLRPPYGAYNPSVTSIAGSMGYSLVLWTVDSLDWKYRNVASILANVKAETKPGAIILMHDGGGERSQTVAAIPKVVDWLLQNGYSLTTVENLL